MARRGVSRAWIAVSVAALLLVGVYVADLSQAPSHPDIVDAAGSSSVAVTGTSSFQFIPSGFNDLATHSTIQVTFTDAGSLVHTFSILDREGVVIPTSTTSSALNALFSQYGALTVINANGAGNYNGNFTSPGVGWYEFVCQIPGHFQSGMYGFIAFGEALPSNLTVTAPNEGPGAAVFIIIGTIVALTVVAVVLGFVIGRRRGDSDEMPPERLGYPEPPAAPGEPPRAVEPPPPPGAPPLA